MRFNYDGFIQQNNWTAGIGHSCCCYIQLLILCDVGKTVNDAVILTKPINICLFCFYLIYYLKILFPQNNMIADALDRFPVYKLPLHTQKMYAFILNRVQNGAEIHMGPFRVLNYGAATEV